MPGAPTKEPNNRFCVQQAYQRGLERYRSPASNRYWWWNPTTLQFFYEPPIIESSSGQTPADHPIIEAQPLACHVIPQPDNTNCGTWVWGLGPDGLGPWLHLLDDSAQYFYVDKAENLGWKRYQDVAGYPWWYHSSTERFFYEPQPRDAQSRQTHHQYLRSRRAYIKKMVANAWIPYHDDQSRIWWYHQGTQVAWYEDGSNSIPDVHSLVPPQGEDEHFAGDHLGFVHADPIVGHGSTSIPVVQPHVQEQVQRRPAHVAMQHHEHHTKTQPISPLENPTTTPAPPDLSDDRQLRSST